VQFTFLFFKLTVRQKAHDRQNSLFDVGRSMFDVQILFLLGPSEVMSLAPDVVNFAYRRVGCAHQTSLADSWLTPET
jgi:hypothetical protein